MQVIGLIGSPHSRGNTDLLVSKILEGAFEGGNQVEKLYLYDFEIAPCIDCRMCKKGQYRCMLKDDMEEIYSKLECADVIVFGTPLYWYGPTAKMKLLIDRLRPYISSGLLRGKKAIIVVPSQEGVQASNCLVEMFRHSLSYLGMELIDQMLVRAYDKAEVGNQLEVLKAAHQVGKGLNKV